MARFIRISAAERSGDVDPHFDFCLAKPIARAALRRALLEATRRQRPAQAGLWTPGD